MWIFMKYDNLLTIGLWFMIDSQLFDAGQFSVIDRDRIKGTTQISLVNRCMGLYI